MKQYEEYKDSGIQWIGKIPKDWCLLPLKYYISFAKGRIPKDTTDENVGFPYLTMDYLRGRKDKQIIYTKDTENLPLMEDDDIIVLWDGANAGEFMRAKKGYLGSTMARVSFNRKKYDGSYFFYLLCSIETISKEFANGTTIPHFDSRILTDYSYPCPDITEQQSIASYLDYKVGQIDIVISEKEKMLEDLKAYRSAVISEVVTKGLDKNVEMKDSGIEWIGMIPKHWNLTKLKNKAKVNGRIGFRGYTTADLVGAGEGAYAIGGKHITNCVLDLSNPDYISWDKYFESPEIMVKKGDLLMAQRGSLGKTALVRDDIGEATINPSLVLLNSIEINQVFLYYYLISNSCLAYIDILNTATAVPMISQNQIENIFIPIPSEKEQLQIADYLDKKVNLVDNSIMDIQSQISDLKSYKSSLITEAVTGKIDLRDWGK